MKINLHSLIRSTIVLAMVNTSTAQERTAKERNTAEDRIRQIQQILTVDAIELKDFPEQMPLVKFLAALERRLPEEQKIWIRLDEAAFGKDFPTIAQTPITFSPCRVTLRMALRKALSQLPEDIEIAIRPAGIELTRPRLAAYNMMYDVRDVVEQIPRLLPMLKKSLREIREPVQPSDGPALLGRFLLVGLELTPWASEPLQPWETVQILNGTRLEVFASFDRQLQIADLIEALRRQLGDSVIMNARLYEVDRVFFAKRVAPLLAGDKETGDRPAVIRIEEALFKELDRQPLLLKGDETKLPPEQIASFLSRQNVFRYSAGPHPSIIGRTLSGIGLEGVTFEVRPLIDPSRRYLRLHITQRVTQLVRVDKTQKLDVATGKEIEIESPNLRITEVSGIVQLPDTDAILMPVLYQPSGKGKNDKVWLMVARPFIRIEEEVKSGVDLSPQTIWNGKFSKEDGPEHVTPDKRLPDNNKVREILQAVVKDVLTNPELKDTRAFYGTVSDNTVTIVDGHNLGWPRQFEPATFGFRLVKMKSPDPFENRNRVLGLRLDKIDLEQKKADLFDAPIQICLSNVGGTANGAVIGGCTVYYVPKRVGKRWTVECIGYVDP